MAVRRVVVDHVLFVVADLVYSRRLYTPPSRRSSSIGRAAAPPSLFGVAKGFREREQCLIDR
jgi:hypothetical protein